MGRNPGRERMFRSRKETGYQTFQRKVKARKQLLGLTTRAYFQYGDRCGSQQPAEEWALEYSFKDTGCEAGSGLLSTVLLLMVGED